MVVAVRQLLLEAGASKMAEDEIGMTPCEVVCAAANAYCPANVKRMLKAKLYFVVRNERNWISILKICAIVLLVLPVVICCCCLCCRLKAG